MDTTSAPESTTAAPPEWEPRPWTQDEVIADARRITELTLRGEKDEELFARVRARSELLREEVFRKHGLLNIAVDLIREGRNPE